MASERSTRSPLTRSRLVTELLANRNTRKNFYLVPVIQLSVRRAVTKQSESSVRPMKNSKFQRASQTTRPSPPQRSRHRAVAHVRPRAPAAHIAWTPPRVHHARSSPTRTFAFRARGRLRRPSCHSVKSEFSCEPRQQHANLGNAGALPHATTAMTR